LYYSHITVFLLALITGLIVFLHARNRLLNQLLFLLTIVFSAWLFINFIAWGSNNSSLTMTVWPFFGVFQALIAALSTYLMYVFILQKDAPFWAKLLWVILIIPVIIFAPTNLTISGFDLAWCDGFAYENLLMRQYYLGLGALSMLWILWLAAVNFKNQLARRQQIIWMVAGIQFFLFLFFFLVHLSAVFATVRYFIFDDSILEFYGIFGMGFFITIIGFLSIKFKTFHVTMIAPQILVLALLVLVASQYTYAVTLTAIILTTVTLILTTTASLIIVRSVKKEIKQKEEIEKLAITLEKANEKLKILDKMKSEFVSIASHQLRSPLTSIRGYSSMLIEGSFGKLTGKALEAIERINESSRFMAASVEDYLNVSRIQAGNMKYEYSDFSIKDLAEKVADDARQSAIKKGLLVTFKSELTTKGIVHADMGKTRQVIDNILNNAMKYTPSGTLAVSVYDKPKLKKIYVSIIDTGIGMSQDSIESMFEKFERASNANTVNVTGTGLGLYIARKMARDMGGDIIASSEGEGKGSTFSIELPLLR
jgi:signal transduction histidine kinase